jgi:hypothetical protein
MKRNTGWRLRLPLHLSFQSKRVFLFDKKRTSFSQSCVYTSHKRRTLISSNHVSFRQTSRGKRKQQEHILVIKESDFQEFAQKLTRLDHQLHSRRKKECLLEEDYLLHRITSLTRLLPDSMELVSSNFSLSSHYSFYSDVYCHRQTRLLFGYFRWRSFFRVRCHSSVRRLRFDNEVDSILRLTREDIPT